MEVVNRDRLVFTYVSGCDGLQLCYRNECVQFKMTGNEGPLIQFSFWWKRGRGRLSWQGEQSQYLEMTKPWKRIRVLPRAPQNHKKGSRWFSTLQKRERERETGTSAMRTKKHIKAKKKKTHTIICCIHILQPLLTHHKLPRPSTRDPRPHQRPIIHIGIRHIERGVQFLRDNVP